MPRPVGRLGPCILSVGSPPQARVPPILPALQDLAVRLGYAPLYLQAHREGWELERIAYVVSVCVCPLTTP